MARFYVALWVSEGSQAFCGLEIKRADEERAILYAQRWLNKSQKSGRYFTGWYDRWTVFQIDQDRTYIHLTSGDDTTTTSTPLNGGESSTAQRVKSAKKSRKIPTISDPWLEDLKITPRTPAARRVTGRFTRSNRAIQPGSTRDRWAIMRENAVRKLADSGNILPMGGSPND